jgi:zinc protease
MKFPTPRIWAALVAACLACRLSGAIPFPQAASDLAPDPAIRFGALPNGVRYVIMPNREPRERVSLRLLVLCGSIDEADDQRGLAHYLEHMAFNGSTHFAPDTLVKYFQRMGMRMGADANASTSFLRTLYQIDLPDHEPATVAQGLQVFSDYAGGLLLTPAMVDKERPIILAEKRTSDSVQFRQYVAQTHFLLGDSLFSRRITIGEKADIDHASREQFVDIYNTWYRPERMAVIVVGDFDPAEIEPQVVAAFRDLVARAPAPRDPDLGQATAALGLHTFYQYEPEAALTSVSINVVAPYSVQPDTAVLRRNHTIRALAAAMVTRRLVNLSKKEGAPLLFGNVLAFERYNFYRQASIVIGGPSARWRDDLAMGEQELRRALQYGFNAEEFRVVVADMRERFQQAADTASTRLSNALVGEIAESLLDNRVFTSPADDLARESKVLDQVTPEECVEALRYAFATPGRYVMVSGDAKIEGDANAAIAEAYRSAQAVAVAAPEAEKELAFAYTDFGPPGKIAERRRVDDLDLTLVTFSNGVRLNLKKTDFEANRVRIAIRVGAGLMLQPPAEPGLDFFIDQTFSAGGLGKHSGDDIRRIMAGKALQTSFRVGEDALVSHSVTRRSDLLTALQLAAAYVSDPGYRPEALRLATKSIAATYNQFEHTPQGTLDVEVSRLLADGDTRFGLPPRETELAHTIGEEKAWLAPQLASGPVEIAIVGDFDVDEAIGDVARTFGALPARAPKPGYRLERQVHFPAKPFTREFTVPTKIPKAVVAMYWPTTDIWDAHLRHRLQLLADVLRDRLRIRIRERMGDAYGVSVYNESSDTFTGYGQMTVTTVVAPDRTGETAQAILNVAGELLAGGVTDEEFERAKKPALAALRDQERTNPYWLNGVLASCQEFPQRLEWARMYKADVESITAADLTAVAKTYLLPGRVFRVKILPQEPAPAQVQPSSEDAAH